MIENTFVIIKPDAVVRKLVGEILKIYEQNNLNIVNMKLFKATPEQAKEHYIEHKDKPFFDNLISYITRSPLVVLELEGEDAISKVRALNGATNPTIAQKGTIRNSYALNSTENSVHASDSPESAKRELAIWF